MINREDMLELTRRMTPARSSVSRLAGAYFDEEGYVDGTFNTHFLKLSQSERSKNLNLAKAVLISKTNEELKDYQIPQTAKKPGSLWQLFDGMKQAELKNDALLDMLYEMIGDQLPMKEPTACYFYFGQYDVPVKGKDGEWLEGSEEVYSYLLCMISPQNGEYEPGLPEFGFLYPAFRDRTGNDSYINIFETKPGKYRKLIQWMLTF